MSGKVLVTVGTTRFDALIRAVDDPDVAAALVAKGYTSLTVQVGSGDYKMRRLLPPGAANATLPSGLQVEQFDFAPTLREHMAGAELIISHAGSGSIFEALRMGKPLIAVPNPILMHNHQAELADELAAHGFIVASTPGGLFQTLCNFEVSGLRPYSKGDPSMIVKQIDLLMGMGEVSDTAA